MEGRSLTKESFEEGERTETTTCGPAESAEHSVLRQGKSSLGFIKGVSAFSHEGKISLSHRNLLTGVGYSSFTIRFHLLYSCRTDQQMKANVMVNLYYYLV